VFKKFPVEAVVVRPGSRMGADTDLPLVTHWIQA
jgi:hypothetical protein